MEKIQFYNKNMKLRIDELNNKIWKEKGYVLPDYDIEKVREQTLNSPRWVHFGAGNIFRAFMVTVNDEMQERAIPVLLQLKVLMKR